MEKIAKSRSKNKSKGIVPQLYLRANKKEAIELKPNKIPKKKLKFNESNRRFGNDITNSIKNNAQFNGFRSFHKKCSSVSNKVNIVGNKNKINGENDNDSTLKKGNSIGRNPPNNNVEKTFSDDNLYHKKKINDEADKSEEEEQEEEKKAKAKKKNKKKQKKNKKKKDKNKQKNK